MDNKKRAAGREKENEGKLDRFDDGMVELEAIVARLERGELPLEEALAAFEAGIALVRALNQRLSDVEARVELLSRDAGGQLRLQPLPEHDTKE